MAKAKVGGEVEVGGCGEEGVGYLGVKAWVVDFGGEGYIVLSC
jgi:hypothetical protein